MFGLKECFLFTFFFCIKSSFSYNFSFCTFVIVCELAVRVYIRGQLEGFGVFLLSNESWGLNSGGLDGSCF